MKLEVGHDRFVLLAETEEVLLEADEVTVLSLLEERRGVRESQGNSIEEKSEQKKGKKRGTHKCKKRRRRGSVSL